MKLSCAKSDFTHAISIVSKAVSSKPQTPILSGIYLKAEGGRLELQATNYEIGFITSIPADVESEGTIVLSGHYLQEVIRRLPNDEVFLSYDEEKKMTIIRSGTAHYNLLVMKAEDFPVVQRIPGEISFDIRDNQLRSLIKKTVFASSTDESRPIFTGVFMDVADTVVTMVATNTHRLAVKHLTFDKNIGKIKVILPARSLNELLHILPESEVPSSIHVVCSFNQVTFETQDVFFSTRLIEGAFPDYKRVIPEHSTTHVKMPTAELSAAFDRVSLISRLNDYHVIRLEFATDPQGKQTLHISSTNPDIGLAEETIPAEIDGPDITISFNASYLVDILKVIGSKECEFALHQPLAPITIADLDDPDFTYVVTPVRTRQ